jgi:voltage-gated potassium channel
MRGDTREEHAKLGARLSYQRESFRRKTNIRRVALGVLVNFLIILLVGSWVLMRFEKDRNPKIDTYGEAVWVSIITVATVGYGDRVPITTGGKVTIVVMLASGAILLSTFISARSKRIENERRKKVKRMKDKIKSRGHYLVCGWNQTAPFLLERLTKELKPERIPVVLLSELEEAPYDEGYVFFLNGAPTSERDLTRANVAEAKAAILLADTTKEGSSSDIDAKTVLTALAIRGLNPEIKMTAEVLLPENLHHLELAGVGEILDSNLVAGFLLARSASHYGLIGLITDIITRPGNELTYRIEATDEMLDMKGEELRKLIKESYNADLVAVTGEEGTQLCSDDIKVRPGDTLLISSTVKPPDAS